MEVLFAALFEIIFSIIIGGTGALIRSLFSKRKFIDILDDIPIVNISVGLLFYGVIVVGVYQLLV